MIEEKEKTAGITSVGADGGQSNLKTNAIVPYMSIIIGEQFAELREQFSIQLRYLRKQNFIITQSFFHSVLFLV